MKKEETIIQENIVKFLNKNRVWHFRYQAQSNKFGLPDLIAIYKGYFVALEVKTKVGVASGLQARTIEDIKDAGGYGGFVTSIEDVQKIFEEIDNAVKKLPS